MAWTSHSGSQGALDVEALHREAASIQAWLASQSNTGHAGKSCVVPPKDFLQSADISGTSSVKRAVPSQSTVVEPSARLPLTQHGTDISDVNFLQRENLALRAEVHVALANQEMLGAEVEAERFVLQREHNELESRSELAREQQRVLNACTEAECAELESQRCLAATRLSRLTETEAALREHRAAEERCRSQELAELRVELEATRDRQRNAAVTAESQVLALREENKELATRLADAAAERSAADAAQATLGLAEDQVRNREFTELTQELGGRARRVQALQEKLARVQRDSAELESQLSREGNRPSHADMGAQRDVLRVLTQTIQRLKPKVQSAKLERADLEESVRIEQGCAEQLRFRDGHEGSEAQLAVQALHSAQQQLAQLRQMYMQMGRRCEDLGVRLAGSPERDGGPFTLSCEGSGCWDDVVLSEREEAALARDSTEMMRLNDELRLAEIRRDNVRDEEKRLIEAARLDRLGVKDLQEQLRRSESRNASLEAQLKPWSYVLEKSF